MTEKFTPEIWPTDIVVTFVPATNSPELPVTAVKTYCFGDDGLLLAKVDQRGWDLPGGHIESGETPESALVRELKEETGASVSHFRLIGYLDILNKGLSRTGNKYPTHSCMLIYKGSGVTFDLQHTFPSLEVSEARFIPIDQLPNFHHDWNESKKEIIDYAFAV